MTKLDRLFNPRGIAVLGASPDLTRGGGQVLRALSVHGYTGPIYPVNPKYNEVQGRRSFVAVDAIDGPCDTAVIALPAAAIPDVIEACGRKGIGFAIVHSGGFRETGNEGMRLEADMLARARAGHVRIVGPNCLGVINVHENVYAAFGSMIRPPLMKPGSVSMVCQSGGFGHSIALHCGAAGIGFRYLVASGNEADLQALDLVEFYLDDPGTRIVISYIEGLDDGRRLMELGRKAAELNKPLILWKGGRGEQGMRAVASHTASMTGRYDVCHAALKQSAIIEVEELTQLADVVHTLLAGRLPMGRRFAVLGGSGGSAIVFADACDADGLAIPELAPEQQENMARLLPSMGSARNPVDFTSSFLNDATTPQFAEALGLVLDDETIDQVLIILSTVQGQRAINGARAMAQATNRNSKPLFVFSSVPCDLMAEPMRIFDSCRIPVFGSPRRVSRAAALVASYAERLRAFTAHERTDASFLTRPSTGRAGNTLNEVETKQWLSALGIPIAMDCMVERDTLLPAWLGPFPVAAKIVSRDLPHKSDVGGVRLNIHDRNELVQVVDAMYTQVAHQAPMAQLDGVIVTPMIDDAVETIVGVVNDESFGPVILLGMGGTLTEVYKDVTYRVAPFDRKTALAMIDELQGKTLLFGVRGRSARDIDRLADAVAAISDIAWRSRGWLRELDINPLFVRGQGLGVIVGDALMVLREE